MKRKRLIALCCGMLCILLLWLYFRPLPLYESQSGEQIRVIFYNEFSANGMSPNIVQRGYVMQTEAQREAIQSLLAAHSCTRTPGTLFSNGHFTEPGRKLVTIFLRRPDGLERELYIGSAGKLMMDGKIYRMDKAEVLIEALLPLLTA